MGSSCVCIAGYSPIAAGTCVFNEQSQLNAQVIILSIFAGLGGLAALIIALYSTSTPIL
jgi:hypothetical protein